MNLYLLRHGIAADRAEGEDSSDAARPLTPEGRDKARRVAQAMQRLELEFDLILTSPCARAQQTAEIVANTLQATRCLRSEDLLAPDGNATALIRRIRALRPAPKELLLVGHEPYLSELMSLLLTGGSGLAVVLKKAGLARLSLERLEPGRCATLEWLVTPRQLWQMV